MNSKVRQSLDFTPPTLREVTIQVNQVKGINLGQGLCLLPTPEEVKNAGSEAIFDGKNTYAVAGGEPVLIDALCNKLSRFNGIACGTQNLLVTHGATGAFEVVCQALLEPGDEVINVRPFYPYHRNALTRCGARSKYVELVPPNWLLDVEQIESLITPKTKFIVFSNPNNPTGRVFARPELEALASLCLKHDLLCVVDEVYEYMTYDGRKHLSIASLPGMLEKTITIGSYSKTFAITGWRIGYLCASEELLPYFRSLHDQIYVCPPTPLQHAVAKSIDELPDTYYEELLSEYSRKRLLMKAALDRAGLPCVEPEGAYYFVADLKERFPGKSSEEVVDVMIRTCGVGAVPASDFLGPETKGDPARSTFLRFCYSVSDSLLEKAGDQLAKMRQSL